MSEARIDLDVVVTAHRVDRAVAAGDRVETRLVCAQRELVAPVDAFLVAPVVRLDVQPAADVGDVRIGEVADELAKCIGLPGAVRVGERDDLGVRVAHGAVLRGDLAAALVADHARAGRRSELLRAVGRGVRGDDELELLAG